MNLTPKQSETFKNNARYKVLNWGRRCFTKDTPITLSNGQEKRIADVQVGDFVVSFNTQTVKPESKKVAEIHKFGVDYCPKPMIQLEVYGETIKSTYDHEYRVGNQWIPVYQLVWGIMEKGERQKLKLLCKQYGQNLDDQSSWWKKDSSDETGARPFWVFKNSDERQNSESPQNNSGELCAKPIKQTRNQSHRQQQNKQQGRKLGMGNTQGKYGTLQKARKISTEVWRALWNAYLKGKRSVRDYLNTQSIKQIKLNVIKGTCTELSSNSRFNKGYFERKDLEISNITVLESQETFDLTVEDNHNYVAHGLVVHNSGKTTVFAYEAFYTAHKIPNSKTTYYAQTFGDARDIAWDIFLEVFGDSVIKKNETLLEIIVQSKAGGNSKVSLKGWESVVTSEKGRGTENDLLLIDEVAFCRGFKQYWDTVLEPTLLTTKGRAVFASTPNGFNDFYELSNKAQNNDDWFYIHATSYDNPYNDKDFLDKKKLELPEDRFAQEYLADFRKQEGLVFKEFSRVANLYNLDLIDAEIKMGGVDFGYVNPAAIVQVIRDKRGSYWVEEKYYEREKTDIQIAEIVSSLDFIKVYPDPENAGAIKELRNKKVNVCDVLKGKDSVKNGINKMRELFKQGRLRIHKDSTNLIWELETYHYPLKKNIGNQDELPVKENDHCLVGDTRITMANGRTKQLKNIKVGELVKTQNGINKVLLSRLTRKDAPIYEIELSNGLKLKGTSDHKIYTNRGKIAINALRYDDRIEVLPSRLDKQILLWKKQSSSITKSITGMVNTIVQLVDVKTEEKDYTKQFGKIKTEKFPMDTTYTTRMEILRIMGYLTLNLKHLQNIYQLILLRRGTNTDLKTKCSRILKKLESLQRNGTQAQRELLGTENTANEFIKIAKGLLKFASNVEKNIRHIQMDETDFAIKIVKRKRCGQEDVYNLTVENDHNYYANGILVKNCIDATRYVIQMDSNTSEIKDYNLWIDRIRTSTKEPSNPAR